MRIEHLSGIWQRMRGLIGKSAPPPGLAVHLSPCRQVHTFFMRYPIDVVHVDAEGVILDIQTLAPWRLGRWHLRARGVLELASGEADRLGLRVGGTIEQLRKS